MAPESNLVLVQIAEKVGESMGQCVIIIAVTFGELSSKLSSSSFALFFRIGLRSNN